MVTCADYRSEQRLLALTRALENEELTEEERRKLREEISSLEKALGMD